MYVWQRFAQSLWFFQWLLENYCMDVRAEHQKNWCFQTGVLEKTLESPRERKEIKPVNPKGNQPWIFNERADAEAKAPTLLAAWREEPTHWKDSDAGKDWGQEEKGVTEEEMFGWHHWLNGHEFEQTPGVGDG